MRHRPLDAGLDLRPLEGLLHARPLHHHQGELLEALVRREAPPAGEALPPAPDRAAVVGGTRVDDLVFGGLAVRTAHRSTVPGGRAGGHALSTRQGDDLAGHEGSTATGGGERVDDGSWIMTRLEPRRDRPQRIAGLHDGLRRGGRAALGDCEG